jgi:hypothetical protein
MPARPSAAAPATTISIGRIASSAANHSPEIQATSGFAAGETAGANLNGIPALLPRPGVTLPGTGKRTRKTLKYQRDFGAIEAVEGSIGKQPANSTT